MTTETPIRAAYLEWRNVMERANHAPSDLPVQEHEALLNQAFQLADVVADMPSADPADFLLKLMAYTFFGQHDVGDGAKGNLIWAEARKLADQVAH